MRAAIWSTQPRPRRALIERVCLAAGVAIGVSGCGSGGAGSTFANPTFIEVSPEEFPQDVPCAVGRAEDGEGEMLSYVATLIDTTSSKAEHLNSPPTSCLYGVRFADVLPQASGEQYHFFAAEILAFDRSNLAPVSPGSAEMESDGETVQPLWQGGCAGAVEPEEEIDEDFDESYWEPQAPRRGRTVILRGCVLEPVEAE